MEEKKSFKFIIVGDAKVGKSTYMTRLSEGKFLKKYDATMGCSVAPISDPNGPSDDPNTLVFNMWDCAGDEKYLGLGETYYAGASGAIVMFDVTSRSSYDNVPMWISKLKEAGINNIVVCGNKVDKKNRVVKPKEIRVQAPYFDLSVKSCYNHGKPFERLLQDM